MADAELRWKRLRELASKATPGKWGCHRETHKITCDGLQIWANGMMLLQIAGLAKFDYANAEYIAACSPTEILELIAERDRLERERDEVHPSFVIDCNEPFFPTDDDYRKAVDVLYRDWRNRPSADAATDFDEWKVAQIMFLRGSNAGWLRERNRAIERAETAEASNASLREQVNELQATIDLINSRTEKGVAMWRSGHSDRESSLPDYGELIEYLVRCVDVQSESSRKFYADYQKAREQVKLLAEGLRMADAYFSQIVAPEETPRKEIRAALSGEKES